MCNLCSYVSTWFKNAFVSFSQTETLIGFDKSDLGRHYDLHFSSGFAPQMPHTPPSFCKNELLLLQVPENLPFFFTKILIAIPATARATSTMEISTSVIFQIYENPSGVHVVRLNVLQVIILMCWPRGS